MKYLIKKIWPLIILLIASYIVIVTKPVDGFAYDCCEAYAVFATYVLAVGIMCRPLGKLIKPQYTDKGWLTCHKWERDGKIYDDLFKVSKYKDGAVNANKIFASSLRMTRDPQTLMMLINETCRSEIVHCLLILISPILLVLISSPIKWLLWGAYIIANLRDIIIQRYNRPRFIRLYYRMLNRGVKENEGSDIKL